MAAPMPLRIARVIVRCYPAAWRRRYAEEMRSLLDETPSSWRSAADLTIGAIREWVAPAHAGWPTRPALTRAQFSLLLAFYAGPMAITWLSLACGNLLRSRAGSPPRFVELVAAIMWLAVSTWLTTGAFRNGAALLRRSPRLPVMLERKALLGMALLALVAGILETASRDATSHFWLSELMPYVRAFTLGSLASPQSARSIRLVRLNQAVVRRLQRRRLLQHLGPTLGLGDGETQP